MLPRTTFLVLSTLLLASAVLPAIVTAKTNFDEVTVVTDTEGDFMADGALDIVAVHIAERYRYILDEKRGDDVVAVRFELRSHNDLKCNTAARYDLVYDAGGPKTIAGGMSSAFSTGSNGCVPQPNDITGKTTIDSTGSLVVTVAKATLGLVDGAELKGLYAISYSSSGGQAVAQDVAPHNNNNAPQSAPPPTGRQNYFLKGTFPYVTVAPSTSLNQYSVGGQEVKYSFKVATHPELRDENIRVRFQIPPDWSVAPSQGTTGADPEGQFTAANDGTARDFAFSLSATGIANEGDVVPVIMEVITDRGGHANITTLTTVSGAKITDPNLTISLLTPGPFDTGTSEVRMSVANATGPLNNIRFALEVTKPGHRSTYEAENVGNGTWKALVNFKDAGSYTVDAYVSSVKPSPHQTFVVQVEEGGLAPAPGMPMILLLVAGLALWRLRSRA
ncbi:MAG TPA: hypothetical protein VI818_02485 [Candidatus Thermoplasmatota archaeon]|nr:hypothetical protein [Candidatus Thermoplasmatota archaeon]